MASSGLYPPELDPLHTGLWEDGDRLRCSCGKEMPCPVVTKLMADEDHGWKELGRPGKRPTREL
ncbi:hypothetical protein JCM9534A_26930 [Catenuloplanes indicus JCM 9534]